MVTQEYHKTIRKGYFFENFLLLSKENKKIFTELSRFCTDRGINFVMLITPISKYYRIASDKKFKELFYETVEECEGVIYLIDMYDDESFDDEDYNDMDHLGDNGAKKMTAMLLNVLHKLNN